VGQGIGHQVEDAKPIRSLAASIQHPGIQVGDCLELMRSLDDRCVDFVMGSPPYCGKMRRYVGGKNKKLTPKEWASWMADVVCESVRICRGHVVFVVNGSVQSGRYNCCCERLLIECDDRGVVCERPAIWHKNAPPNRRDWFGNDWEYCLAFRSEGSRKTWNWELIASPPKYTTGGRFRQRGANGSRREGGTYPVVALARPRDVIRITVGGGHLGWSGASENEAPYPLKLAERFVLPLTNPGDAVLDPFLGSGTTLHAAMRHGRKVSGFDNRESQIELTMRRLRWLEETSGRD